MTVKSNSKSKEFRGFAYVIISDKNSFERILELFKNKSCKKLLFRGIH